MRRLYDLLQVSPDAAPEVIAAAFRALSKRYHPDVNKAADANKVMTEINRAYEVLNDPVARTDYDRLLAAQQSTQPRPQSNSPRRSKSQSYEDPTTGWTEEKRGPEVRGKTRDSRFISFDNGRVIDTQMGLMWAETDNGSEIDWKGAKNYCENYRVGRYTNWRMPTLDELAELYDKTKTYKSDCGYAVHITELIRLTGTAPWASETRNFDAAYYNFYTGERGWIQQSYKGNLRALPVRSGK